MNYDSGHEMSRTKMKLIYEEIELGRQIQISHPQIVQDYRGGMTRPEIAAKYGFSGCFSKGDGTKASVCSVGFALRGNRSELGPKYEGLISEEELDQTNSQRSRVRALRALDHLDPKLRTLGAHRALKSRGIELWGEDETSFAWLLSGNQEYRTSSGRVNNERVAMEVNLQFHNGRTVRNANGVYQTLLRLRRQLESQEPHKS